MADFRQVLIKHILSTTNKKDIPNLVHEKFNGDFKLYLYTLTTPDLGEIILNR